MPVTISDKKLVKPAASEKGESELARSLGALVQERPAVSMLLISLLGFLIYSNTYKVPFVFDDLLLIVNNDSIRNFHDLMDGWTYTRFTGVISFAINYRINGMNVMGYHLFNLAIHVMNAIMVFWLAALTLKAPFFKRSKIASLVSGKAVPLIALFTALFFIVHPVQTQAVTYTVQRFASLSTFFYLLALLLYVKWRSLPSEARDETGSAHEDESGSKRTLARISLYALSLVSVVLAMNTKEIAFTLPLVLVLWEFSFQSGKIRRRILYLLPYLATLFLIPVRLLLSNNALFSGAGDTPVPSMIDYLFTQFRVIVTYLRLLLLPINQNLDYDYPVYNSFTNTNVWLSFIFLAMIFSAGIYLFIRSRKGGSAAPLRLAAFGIFWFFITISVESSFISIADVIFEHRLYLPSIGFFLTAVTLLVMAAAYLKDRVPALEKGIVVGMVLCVGVLAMAAYARNNVWSDPISLWYDTVQKSPLKARPHINLGTAYIARNQVDKGIHELKQAVELRPDYPIGLIGLATAYQMNGRFTEAGQALQRALEIDPGSAEAHDHMGANYRAEKQIDKAIAEYQIAIEINPDNPNSYYNLGSIYSDMGQKDEAMKQYELAVQYKPDFADAHNNLGVGYASRGEFDMAIDEFMQVLTLEPDFAQVYNNLGLCYAAKGDLNQAEAEFRQAIDKKSDFTGAYLNLGNTYIDMNRYDDATGALQKAAQLDPKNFEAHRQLGNAYRLEGQKDKALAEYKAALAIKPGDEEVTNQVTMLQGTL